MVYPVRPMKAKNHVLMRQRGGLPVQTSDGAKQIDLSRQVAFDARIGHAPAASFTLILLQHRVVADGLAMRCRIAERLRFGSGAG
jgi:hypothetical protein